MRRVLDELKYHSEYGFILLMGISKTSDFARFFELKESKETTGAGNTGSEFVCTLTYNNKRFRRTGTTKKEARWAAAEALLAECRITEAQIKEKALDVFELATKKHAELSRDHIHEEFDDKAQARCSYKSPMIGFENVVSASFRNKRDAKKDLVFKLLKSIWADMERKLDVIRARGVEYKEMVVVTNPPATFVTRNKSTALDISSACTLSKVQQQPAPPPTLQTKQLTNGHHNPQRPSNGMLTGNWLKDPLPKPPTNQMANLNMRMDTDLDSQPIEKNVGDHNVCLICMRNRLAKRMRDIYGADCKHDSYICDFCVKLHKQMKNAKRSANAEVCPLCYLLSYNKADHQMGRYYGVKGDSVFSEPSTLPLSCGVSNPIYTPFFNNEKTRDQMKTRKQL